MSSILISNDQRRNRIQTLTPKRFTWKYDRDQHKLHTLCSRICSLPAGLTRYFIENFSEENDIVFDPFSGKGTVPLEANVNNRIGYGNDISPEAWLLTAAKTRPINKYYLNKFLKNLQSKIKTKKNNVVPDDLKIFFHEENLNQIMQLRKLLKKNTKYSIFVKAVLLGILHGSSNVSLSLKCSHSYSMSPGYVERYAKEHKLIKPKRDVMKCIKGRIETLLEEGIPSNEGKAFMDDSRKLSLDSSTVSLIITSPPYFATQTYAYDNWLRLWFLGHNYRDVHQTQVNTNNEEKYAKFMEDSFKEMFRVLKPDSYAFIVVGDIVKNRTTGPKLIKTAEMLSPIAENAGFETVKILIDEIPQHKKVLSGSLLTEGIKTERILCLYKNREN